MEDNFGKSDVSIISYHISDCPENFTLFSTYIIFFIYYVIKYARFGFYRCCQNMCGDVVSKLPQKMFEASN